MAALATRIGADLKQAMRARDSVRKTILKGLKAALDKEAKDKGRELREAEEIAVLATQRKQRLEAAQIYAEHDDAKRAEAEEAEAKLIASYLPAQLDASEVAAAIDAALAATGASSPAEMGKVMGALKGELAGKADMKAVAQLVKERLQG